MKESKANKKKQPKLEERRKRINQSVKVRIYASALHKKLQDMISIRHGYPSYSTMRRISCNNNAPHIISDVDEEVMDFFLKELFPLIP